MKEILITSSVLIFAVLLLRWAFRGRVSHGLIYGAWLLVAVRLLVPVQLGSFDFSILSRTEPVTNAMEQAANTPVAGQSREEIRQEVELEYFIRGEDLMPQIQAILELEKLRNPNIDSQWEQLYEEIVQEKPVEQVFTQKAQTQIEQAVQQRAAAPTIGQIAVGVWLVGTAVMGVWFLWVNLSFGAKLRRSGEPVEGVEAEVPVRMSRAISSPCLFGLWRPVIWLTPQCMESEARLRHVLAHERTHRKHLDHIWSLVRCVCLCVYWFNPLVWVAASLSKRDCELACDEAALKKLGDSERVAYGKTLVDLVASNISAGQLLETATAMHETKKQLKTRVGYIVKKPKVLLTAVVVLILLLAVVTGCSFAGQQETQPELNVPETTENTEETESTKATEPKPAETQPAPTQPVETQPQPTQPEPTQPEPTQPEPTEPSETQTHLAKLGALFLNPDTWYHKLLGYMHGGGIKVLFADGFPDESRQPTAAEWQELKDEEGFAEGLQLIRLPVEKVDAILTQYLGTCCAQLYPYSFKGLTYLESTNCLYFMTDTTEQSQKLQNLKAVDFGKTGTGLYFMTYTADGFSGKQRVYVKPYGDEYRILGTMSVININDTREQGMVPIEEQAQARTVLDPSEYSVSVCCTPHIASGTKGMYNDIKRVLSLDVLQKHSAPSDFWNEQIYDFDYKDEQCKLSFKELTKKYDEAFFATKALLLVTCVSQNGQLPVISRIDFGDDTMADIMVYVDNTDPIPVDPQMYTVIIELPREYVDFEWDSAKRQLYDTYKYNGVYWLFDEHFVLEGENPILLDGEPIIIEDYDYRVCINVPFENMGPGAPTGIADFLPSMKQLNMYREQKSRFSQKIDYDGKNADCPISFNEALDTYDEVFFENSMLVIAEVQTKVQCVPVVKKVLIVNGELRIYYEQGEGEIMKDDQGRTLFFDYPILLEIPAQYRQYINRGLATAVADGLGY